MSYFEIYAYNFRSTGDTLKNAIINYYNDAVREGHSPSYEGTVHHIVDGIQFGCWDLSSFQNL